MGTHPIFESDFDCLTEFLMLPEDTRELDQRFFEERLQKSIGSLHPYAVKWRVALLIITILTVFFTYCWLNDPSTSNTPLMASLRSHPFFILSCMTLITSFAFGIHQRVVAPSILVQRIRLVLEDYGMSITQEGSLSFRR